MAFPRYTHTHTHNCFPHTHTEKLKCFLNDFVFRIFRKTEPREYIGISERRFTLRNWLGDYGGQSLDSYLQVRVPGKLEAYFQSKLGGLTTRSTGVQKQETVCPSSSREGKFALPPSFCSIGLAKKACSGFSHGKT